MYFSPRNIIAPKVSQVLQNKFRFGIVEQSAIYGGMTEQPPVPGKINIDALGSRNTSGSTRTPAGRRGRRDVLAVVSPHDVAAEQAI
jgi:hypothetical protein